MENSVARKEEEMPEESARGRFVWYDLDAQGGPFAVHEVKSA